MSEKATRKRKIGLPKTIKKKWVAMLRSRKYRQGKGHLYTPSNRSYCCLGLLCKAVDVRIFIASIESGEELYGQLPEHKVFLGRHVAERLAQMNDGGESFADIADYVERSL